MLGLVGIICSVWGIAFLPRKPDSHCRVFKNICISALCLRINHQFTLKNCQFFLFALYICPSVVMALGPQLISGMKSNPRAALYLFFLSLTFVWGLPWCSAAREAEGLERCCVRLDSLIKVSEWETMGALGSGRGGVSARGTLSASWYGDREPSLHPLLFISPLPVDPPVLHR